VVGRGGRGCEEGDARGCVEEDARGWMEEDARGCEEEDAPDCAALAYETVVVGLALDGKSGSGSVWDGIVAVVVMLSLCDVGVCEIASVAVCSAYVDEQSIS
jgi:hypothetical protein